MKKFKLQFLCADQTEYIGECVSLQLPLLDGSAGILANHSDMRAILQDGVLVIDTGEEKLEYAVTEGLVRIHNGSVLLLAFSAEKPDEIDEKRAQDAAARAKERLKRRQSELEYRQSQADLSRALNRLRVKHRG